MTMSNTWRKYLTQNPHTVQAYQLQEWRAAQRNSDLKYLKNISKIFFHNMSIYHILKERPELNFTN